MAEEIKNKKKQFFSILYFTFEVTNNQISKNYFKTVSERK